MLAAIQDNDLLDDHEAEADRTAYNAAFEALGLNWHWDPVTHACLPRGAQGVRRYIEQAHPHLLRAYDVEFLVSAVEAARLRCAAAAQRA